MWQRFSSAWVKDFPFYTLTHCRIAQTHPQTFSTECVEDFPDQLHSVRRRPIEKPPTQLLCRGLSFAYQKERSTIEAGEGSPLEIAESLCSSSGRFASSEGCTSAGCREPERAGAGR